MTLASRRRWLLAGLVLVLGLVLGLFIYAVTQRPADDQDDASSATGSGAAPTTAGAASPLALDSLRGPLTGERFYFMLPDRFANGDPSNDQGGLSGDRTVSGYDPTDKAFFHGGDLAGVTQQLDYLEGLGVTAIWLTPVMTNQAVQGPPGQESAAYHGYWVTDFTAVDPHLGTLDDLEELVTQAHDREMKVFLDIITNHTADVIDFEEGDYSYRPSTEPPYTPVLEPAERDLKVPDWLNDTANYHNRGNSTFEGESSLLGDFFGLDDLATERPEVVEGMIGVYSDWVDVGVDGFRIDTVKHVNLEFWSQFGPAILAHAAEQGNEDFFMFGEVFDASPITMSTYTTQGALPATLDFGFQAAATAYLRGESAAGLGRFYDGDDWYTDADSNAYALPTFLGNHDMGRFPQFLGGVALVHRDLPERVALGHTLMFLTRGQPVVYYGDEQGFIGRRGDQDARHDMFATQVEQFAEQDLVVGEPGSRDRYDTSAPLYQHIAELSALREEHPALADGAQITRYAADGPGVFAVSRLMTTGDDAGVEYVVAVNNDVSPASAQVSTYSAGMEFAPVWGTQATLTSDASGALAVEVPAMSAVVYRAASPLAAQTAALPLTVVAGELSGRAQLQAELGTDPAPFAQVTFAVRPAGGGAGDWTVLGTDDAPPYRVYVDVATLPEGQLEVQAVAKPFAGPVSVATAAASVAAPAQPPAQGQPASVSLPGTFNAVLGCSADWSPECLDAGLAWDPSTSTWQATWDLPAGSYEFKVAIDGAWQENYGAGGALNGDNLNVAHPGGPVTFVYDHSTHLVSTS